MILEENQLPRTMCSFAALPSPISIPALKLASTAMPSRWRRADYRGPRQSQSRVGQRGNRHLRGTVRKWLCPAEAEPRRDFTAAQPQSITASNIVAHVSNRMFFYDLISLSCNSKPETPPLFRKSDKIILKGTHLQIAREIGPNSLRGGDRPRKGCVIGHFMQERGAA